MAGPRAATQPRSVCKGFIVPILDIDRGIAEGFVPRDKSEG